MRISKMLTLILIGSHLLISAQEEPATTPNDQQESIEETVQQEPTEELIDQKSMEESPTTEENQLITESPAKADESLNDTQSEESEKVEVILAEEPQGINLPAEPEPTIDDAIITNEQITTQSPIGIDTVSLEDPQGNWLFKRIWWERAEERYEKIRLLVDAIWKSRTDFFIKRNDLDKKVLDPFYIYAGLSLGELQIILSELIDSLEKQRERQGDLNEEERESFESLIAEQESLKQLKNDVDSIANLDHAIDNALEKLMDQINNARNLEAQAWNNFKEIAHILNDTKARELYYMIEGAARNIKNISTYLEQSFLKHFDTLIYETKNHIAQIQKNMLAMKEKGIVFKSQAEQNALQEKEEQEQEDAAAQEEEERENKPKQKTGLLNWIMTTLNKTVNFFITLIKLPYNMIFGGK